MHLVIAGIAALLLTLAGPVRAETPAPGGFDYYVLALSWSPNWCALEGDARQSVQCNSGGGFGWVLHGLWPQYHRGYPSFCNTAQRPPSRAMTRAMADVMGAPGVAWHQWKKHGTCSGLAATDYFALARAAYASVARPEVFRKLDRAVKLPASVVQDAFLKANSDMVADGITITCRGPYIQEVRICLSRDLVPVPCGQDVVRDCSLKNAIFEPLR